MKSIKAIFVLSVSLLLNVGTYAQGPDTKGERKELMSAFNQRYENRWRIRWNETTGTPSSILGHKITSYNGAPLEIALVFLKDEKGMMGIADVEYDLELKKTNYSERGGTRLVFTQKYQGVPIIASGYLVAVDNDGSIYYVSGDYYPEVSLNTTPTLTSTEIRSIVQSDLPYAVLASLTEPLLSIKAEVNMTVERYTLVYQLEARNVDFTEAWHYTIDANNGSIIAKTSLIEKVNGSGYVYQTNPLHGGTVTRTIHRLRDITPRKLDGDNVIVYNDSTSEASHPYGLFFYSSTHTHFDEVMAYYHSDELEAWLIGKGMETGRVGKVTIHTEDSDPYRYAAAASANRIIWFSDGESFSGLRNPTKEAAVINHEYMHVVSETYNALTQNNEADAMDESYSDYFGVAYTNQFYSDATIGEYIDEAGGLVYRRELINTYTYSQFGNIDLEPNGEYEEHDNSVIFSGASWDFRRDGDVNSSIADELVLESLNNLGSNPTFLDGRDALEAAATVSGYSSYLNDIADAFYGHGIGGPWVPPLSVNISGPSYLEYKQYGTFTANVSGGSGTISYQWYKQIDGSSYWTERGTNQSQLERMYIKGFTVKVVVARGGLQAEETHYCSYGVPPMIVPVEPIVAEISAAMPKRYALAQNHPNPFNPSTTIEYDLPEASSVGLAIYDMLGREVMRWEGLEEAGYRQVVWYGTDERGRTVPTGIYIYRLVAASVESEQHFTASRKMVLMK